MSYQDDEFKAKLDASEEAFNLVNEKLGNNPRVTDYLIKQYIFHKGRNNQEYLNEIMNTFVSGLNTLYEGARLDQSNAECTAVSALQMVDKSRLGLKKNLHWLDVVKRYLPKFKCVNTSGLNKDFFPEENK